MSSEQKIAEVLRDRYEILSSLGEGGFGTVYKARQSATGQLVALKVLRLLDGCTEGERDTRLVRFHREMTLCAQLHHPNIVRLIDSGHAGQDVIYTVFEFAPGKDLAQVLADEGRLDPVEAKYLMLQTLDALACAHGQSVVHRDLKPANIMVTQTGARRNAIVLDFGIGAMAADAKREEQARLTQTHESIGTPSYAAPEQLRGQAPTRRSDIYAWGLLFIECLTGRRVIDGESMAEVAFKQLSPDPIPIPDGVAEHPLGSLLRRATIKDPRARNVSAESLLRELEACDVRGLKVKVGQPRLQPVASSAATATMEISVSLPGKTPERLIEGERRQVSAVCCTFQVSSAAEEAGDAEEIDHLLDQQQDACVAIARRFGGHVAGALGDMLLLYFGYPSAREDDAARAARAALAILSEVQARNAQLSAERGVSVAARLGVHTGLIVARDPGDAAVQASRSGAGMTPKQAARMSAQAAPGTIVISAETQRLLRKDFLVEPAGTLRAEGQAATVELYLLHEGSPAWREDDLPLVGRSREMSALLEQWGRVRGGAGHAVLLTGEAGIGKSRLVRELGRRIEEERHTWLDGRCAADVANTALFPIIELLHRMVDPAREGKADSKSDKLEALLSHHGFDLAEAMPLFGQLLGIGLPPRYPSLDVPPQKQRELTSDAVLSLLFEMAEKEPLVLVLEDLHWADPSTLKLLDQLVGEAASSPILALFTARSEFTPEWSPSAVQAIQLDRLDVSEVAQMTARLTGGRALPDGVLEQVVSRTDGVPLFVEELVRAMIEAGALVERDDRYALAAPLSQLSIPTTLRDSLVARLDRLGRAKETAQVASAIGREFTFELLRAVSPLDEAALEEDLDKLIAAEIVCRKRRIKNRAYVFKHGLARDAAYGSMLRRSQREVHARIAKVLKRRFPEIVNERPEVLAQHHAAAEQKKEAIECAQQAAMGALRRSAYAEAVALSRRALEWLDGIEPEIERAALELTINSVLTPALMSSLGWRAPEVKATANRSLELLDEVGDSPFAGPTMWILALYYSLGGKDRESVRALLGRLLSLAARTRDAGLEAVTLQLVAHCAMLEGRLADAKRLLDRSISLCDPVEHQVHRFIFGQDTAVVLSISRSVVLHMMGYLDQAIAQINAILDGARDLKHAASAGIAMSCALLVRHDRGEPAEVLKLAEDHRLLAERYGLTEQVVNVAILRAWAAGDVESARQHLATREALGSDMGLSVFQRMVAEIEADRGMHEDALRRVERALREDEEKDERHHRPHLLALKARVVLAKDPGAHLQADEILRQASGLAREQGQRTVELKVAIALARLLHARGRTAEASGCLSPVYEQFTEGYTAPLLIEARDLLTELSR